MILLIVDDDEQIRTGMQEGIDWSALGIQNVITAANGLEALERFNEHLPEIVITDVRMPGMDGLELLRRIKQISPITRVIILSGFNEFEYLKAAIQLDAVDYEMKPIKARSLIALIQKVKEDIIRERMTNQEFNKYLQSYKNNFATELLSGGISDRLIILEGLQQYFSFDATGTLIGISVIIDGNGNGDFIKTTADKMIDIFENSELSSRGVCLKIREDKLFFLLKTETISQLYCQQYISEIINQLRMWNRELKSNGLNTFSAGISNPINVSEFVVLLNQAHQALAVRFYKGNGSIHLFSKMEELQEGAISGLLENVEFKSYLARGDLKAVGLMVHNEFEHLKSGSKYSRKSVSAYSRSLLQLIMITLANLPGDIFDFVQGEIISLEERSEYLSFNDVENIVLNVLENIEERLSKKLSPIMVRAEEFIHRNFTHELTVEMLSEYIGKTPNYFSHLFKRELGITFKEYVTRLRISKAKELIINTNDLIYEISEKVGFSDYNYFTQVFKKIEGHPPAFLRRKE
ncbi:hypothetical protein P40081_27830 [Paenibacillus sp. FSL P4-0081]|uniref:response regulator transcription factor n=1 Tax=unclassified Paenibacillus TaxID=185978 RepID=UPI0004F6AD3C|nr:response regulator [Paenibacillus sp. FSL P4-0081]AIQ31534.1 hypothetical protein P40081_27830 [Paenibacillus sp. FSL P4-0081]